MDPALGRCAAEGHLRRVEPPPVFGPARSGVAPPPSPTGGPRPPKMQMPGGKSGSVEERRGQ
eukprot:9885038-Lingulodinium_polyedra.AAC.1